MRGRILSRGEPVEGVDVFAEPLSGGEEHEAESATGIDGRYELLLAEPGVHVFALEAAHGEHVVEHSVPDEAFVEIDFEVHGGRLSGRVTDGDGAPLPGVSVTLAREGAPEGERRRLESTGRRGNFRFDWLEAGTYTLRAPDGRPLDPFFEHGRVLRTGLRVDDHRLLDGVELSLPSRGFVSGVVVDAHGNPRGGAWVRLLDSRGRAISFDWEVRSDANGSFGIGAIAPGTYTALARDEGGEGASAPFTVEADRNGMTRITLR